jgi:valyl-tRNA synthetase
MFSMSCFDRPLSHHLSLESGTADSGLECFLAASSDEAAEDVLDLWEASSIVPAQELIWGGETDLDSSSSDEVVLTRGLVANG